MLDGRLIQSAAEARMEYRGQFMSSKPDRESFLGGFKSGAAWAEYELRLTWTAERPAVPGWYWVNAGGSPMVCRITRNTIDAWDWNRWPVCCRFAGPIPDPAESAKEVGDYPHIAKIRKVMAEAGPPGPIDENEVHENSRGIDCE